MRPLSSHNHGGVIRLSPDIRKPAKPLVALLYGPVNHGEHLPGAVAGFISAAAPVLSGFPCATKCRLLSRWISETARGRCCGF